MPVRILHASLTHTEPEISGRLDHDTTRASRPFDHSIHVLIGIDLEAPGFWDQAVDTAARQVGEFAEAVVAA